MRVDSRMNLGKTPIKVVSDSYLPVNMAVFMAIGPKLMLSC